MRAELLVEAAVRAFAEQVLVVPAKEGRAWSLIYHHECVVIYL
jgi:hypothetical protein